MQINDLPGVQMEHRVGIADLSDDGFILKARLVHRLDVSHAKWDALHGAGVSVRVLLAEAGLLGLIG